MPSRCAWSAGWLLCLALAPCPAAFGLFRGGSPDLPSDPREFPAACGFKHKVRLQARAAPASRAEVQCWIEHLGGGAIGPLTAAP